MATETLTKLSRAEVERHNTERDCYVTLGNKVYDVTSFLFDHPGGHKLILDYAGKDIKEILEDGVSHTHSDAAYDILDDSLVGYLKPEQNGAIGDANGEYVHPRTGMSNEEDLSKDTDYNQDYKKHKFLDLSKPLFPQLWYGNFSKKFYLDQVHRPRHYKGGQSAPLFGNFLEPLTKTPWWMIPILWLPCDSYGSYLAFQGWNNPIIPAAYWALGFFIWSLVEYTLHRFLFHLDDYLPDNRYGIIAHFLLHGIHHYLPMDRYRLVMPPTMFVVLATPFWYLAHTVFAYNWYAATAVYCGGIFGYICYDLTHYFLHHENLPLWYKDLKKYHLEHHFLEYELGFGVTTRFWDNVFGTELKPNVIKTQ
ncbi:hypothetical protein ACHAPX_000745 [Trichoderma viride]|jgi:4-hydroxysphinganine ceramide fatty acyl 2-hydroxylase